MTPVTPAPDTGTYVVRNPIFGGWSSRVFDLPDLVGTKVAAWLELTKHNIALLYLDLVQLLRATDGLEQAMVVYGVDLREHRAADGLVLDRYRLEQLLLYQQVPDMAALQLLLPVIAVLRQCPIVIVFRLDLVGPENPVWCWPCGHWWQRG